MSAEKLRGKETFRPNASLCTYIASPSRSQSLSQRADIVTRLTRVTVLCRRPELRASVGHPRPYFEPHWANAHPSGTFHSTPAKQAKYLTAPISSRHRIRFPLSCKAESIRPRHLPNPSTAACESFNPRSLGTRPRLPESRFSATSAATAFSCHSRYRDKGSVGESSKHSLGFSVGRPVYRSSSPPRVRRRYEVYSPENKQLLYVCIDKTQEDNDTSRRNMSPIGCNLRHR